MAYPKGRPREHPTRAKMTPAQVIAIRRRYAKGGETQTAIAREYGVLPCTIMNIVDDITWQQLPGTWSPELWTYPITEEEGKP